MHILKHHFDKISNFRTNSSQLLKNTERDTDKQIASINSNVLFQHDCIAESKLIHRRIHRNKCKHMKKQIKALGSKIRLQRRRLRILKREEEQTILVLEESKSKQKRIANQVLQLSSLLDAEELKAAASL